jgi:hypothetical protein
MGQLLDRTYSRANSSGRAAIDAQYGVVYPIVMVVILAFGGFAQLIVWMGGYVMLAFGR